MKKIFQFVRCLNLKNLVTSVLAVMMIFMSVGFGMAASIPQMAVFTPPFTIAVANDAPASDIVLASDIADKLQANGYSINTDVLKLFSEVDGMSLDKKVTLVIYKGNAVIVVGATSAPEHVAFASQISRILKEKSVSSKSILSSEIKYSDLQLLFDGKIPVVFEKEYVKCVFEGAGSEQKCYLAEYNDKYYCSGKETCTMEVYGEKDKKMVWKSTCGGYAYTIMDGESEYAKFECSGNAEIIIKQTPDLIIENLKFNAESNSIEFETKNIGDASVTRAFSDTIYIDGEYYDAVDFSSDQHSDSKCASSASSYSKCLPDYMLAPGQSAYRTVELPEYYVASEHEITVVADRNKNGYGNIDELNEGNNKATIAINTVPPDYSADLENYPDLFIKNGRFNGYIVIGDTAPAEDVLSATDIAKSISEYSDVNVGSARLASEISDPFSMNLIVVGNPCNNEVAAELIYSTSDVSSFNCRAYFNKPGRWTIKLFENNGHIQILVAGYTEKDTRNAAKVLAHWKDYHLKGKEFSGTEEVIETPIEPKHEFPVTAVYLNESETSEIVPSMPMNSADCNGCIVNGACIPFGTRLVDNVPKYCDITKSLSVQKEKGGSCQNNYECGTNQCNDGICGSLAEDLKETRSMLQKVLDWLANIF